MNRNAITEISEEILDGFREWFGPSGKCWCEKKKKFVEPDQDPSCTDCQSLHAIDLSNVRYFRLRDDYRTY